MQQTTVRSFKILEIAVAATCVFVLAGVLVFWGRLGSVAEETSQGLELIPLVGIGPARFGMSKDQVVALLGEPDEVIQNGLSLSYATRGFSVGISPKRGLSSINCYTRQSAPMGGVKDFAGTTKEGVAMGCGLDHIVAAYGEPDDKKEHGPQLDVSYKSLQMWLTLVDNSLVQIMVVMPSPSQ